MGNFLENKNIDTENKRNIAFQSVVATREAVSISRRKKQPISYRSTISIISELDENYHNALIKYVLDKNESETVRHYKELAELQSIDGNQTSPKELIQARINEIDKLLSKSDGKKRFKSVRNEKNMLENAILFFNEIKLSEHKLIENDFFVAERDDFTIKRLFNNVKFKDYQVTNNRILRMRILHPDKEEHITGADLVYEQYNLKRNEVRIILLQYKTWDNRRIYIDDRSRNQLNKMEMHFCDNTFCNGYNNEKFPQNYRFPFCSVFLRPTSKYVNEESKLITTGVHIPVCEVKKLIKNSNSFTKSDAYFKNISHQIFDELFNTNMIGSKWIKINELELFYKKIGIESNIDRIKIYAQEFNKELLFEDEAEDFF